MSIVRPILFSVLILLHQTLSAQTNPQREYMLKAVFLFNFTQFVDWPPNSFDSSGAPLIIGILGKNPFGNYLEQTVKGEQINGHEVIVKYFENEEAAKDCHILFINLGTEKEYLPVIEALKGKNILTVSDDPDFSRKGGMISFLTRQNKIKLQINLDASQSTQLVLSSKLLRLAEIIKSKEN